MADYMWKYHKTESTVCCSMYRVLGS